MEHISDAAIATVDLTVDRGSSVGAVRGVTVTVPRGSLVGLLGPSGSGKTSLMRAIMGVQRRVSGQVTVLGLPAGSPALRNRIGYVTQDVSVYDDLTVRENLSYFRAVLGAPKSDIERVILETDLAGQTEQLVGSLSGGQRSRASLAAALLGAPELLVLDEPTVGLDPVLRVQLWTLFRRLAEQGNTLLVSSHVMDEAIRCDRLLLMRAGEILADETPAGLLESTGSTDAESAFLTLIARRDQQPAEGAA
ncbi:ABC transporter ATP-binding protein [Salinibacterium sp. ZJ454]|uniref:ABC transporter ATP-binding protein n=1 Tax=Salinibacterium sp. ZJ454 TaxID=2708339 RepID=UPI00141EBC46|nr:ABC transporter ATP-binding protein [Salinibacterium sp. ZJ454]